MSAQEEGFLSVGLQNELARLVRAGFSLVPLGGSGDGKAPLLKVWAGSSMPLS